MIPPVSLRPARHSRVRACVRLAHAVCIARPTRAVKFVRLAHKADLGRNELVISLSFDRICRVPDIIKVYKTAGRMGKAVNAVWNG